MSTEIYTTPVLHDLCELLHVADVHGQWPESKPIAQLASSYVGAIGRELQSEFDIYELKQQTLDEQMDALVEKMNALKSQFAEMESFSEVTTDDVSKNDTPEFHRDTFTPDQHRNLLDSCLQSIKKLG